jgi:transcription termination/antitermination protein NusA
VIVIKTFSEADMQAISFFEKATGTQVKDCLINGESAYFLVDNAGAALGKNGSKIKQIQKQVKKRVKVFEFAEDVKQQVGKMIPEAKDIKVDGTSVVVEVPRESKAQVIGKDGANINKIRELLQRNHKVESVKVV